MPSSAVNDKVGGPSEIERRTHQIGSEMLRLAREHRAGVLSSRFWSDWLMSWAMKDPAFKVQLFRFVDVFPMLHRPEHVYDYLVDYLGQPGVTLPPGMDFGLRAGAMAKGAMARAISQRITAMARSFIAGADARSAMRKLHHR